MFVVDLLPHWPETHWDHWLRASEQRRERDTLFPEVSRARHIGEQGANMDETTFRRYDRHIVLNHLPSAQLPEAQAMTKAPYEAALHGILASAFVVRDLQDLVSISEREPQALASSICASCQTASVVFYAAGMSADEVNLEGRISAHSPWKPISNFFGLWHEPRRGRHAGLHRCVCVCVCVCACVCVSVCVCV